tara:strand:- start:1520 stop:1678 length:159 start_codon:yes stop_codon:yes gene_type:complete
MTTYKFQKAPEGSANVAVLKDGKTSIPLDGANNDYQEYLEWVAAGNTTEAAD